LAGEILLILDENYKKLTSSTAQKQPLELGRTTFHIGKEAFVLFQMTLNANAWKIETILSLILLGAS